MDDRRRCTATISDGSRRCKKAPIKGGTVCESHGGGAPQVRAAADRRLAELVEPAIKALDDVLDGNEKAGDLIRAAQVVLDRTGYGPTSKLEIAEKVKEKELGRVVRALQEAGVTPEQISAARSILELEDAGDSAATH